MQLLEIKNNLAKLSYSDNENPVLGRFIVLTSEAKSYVAQFVNLKSDLVNSFAIAKLLFTFTPEGIVDNYDGSIPNMNSEISFLPPDELLSLLPVETPVKVGNLAQQNDLLELDVSVFERNLVVFAQKDSHKTTFISNCVRQLFQMKEKSVIIDTCNLFEDYKKIVFTKDFKLPLNSKMIDYIFEYELAEVEPSTKAVIQDIFYAVQQYIQTLEFEFLPIDNFVEVVANQYKETQMPELALLKNKLLKYRDANVFANTKEEVLIFKEKLDEKNCSIIDIKDIHESLQKEVLSFIHSILETYDKYVYFFVPLTDDSSDKRLLKQFINHNRVFTTIIVSSSYKYANELKQHAQNMLLFAPQDMNHDFSAYSTFLNKLNLDECIVFGKLTQGIPFIIEMSDLNLDLTMEDVAGDRYQFVPVSENLQLVHVDEFGEQTPVNFDTKVEVEEVIHPEPKVVEPEPVIINQVPELVAPIPEISQPAIEVVEETVPVQSSVTPITVAQQPEQNSVVEPIPVRPVENIENTQILQEPAVDFTEEKLSFNDLPMHQAAPVVTEPEVIEPVANVFDEEPLVVDNGLNDQVLDLDSFAEIDELEQIEEFPQESFEQEVIEPSYEQEEVLTEDDLNFMEENQIVQSDDVFGATEIIEPSGYVEESTPVVPIYPVEDPIPELSAGEFQRGDTVTHIRYGRGVIEKIIKYGNKNLCAITFENVGRRLLDPSISELTKI